MIQRNVAVDSKLASAAASAASLMMYCSIYIAHMGVRRAVHRANVLNVSELKNCFV